MQPEAPSIQPIVETEPSGPADEPIVVEDPMPVLIAAVAERIAFRHTIASNDRAVEELIIAVRNTAGQPSPEAHPALAGGEPFAELAALPDAVHAAIARRAALAGELASVEAELVRAQQMKRNLIIGGVVAAVVLVLILVVVLGGGG